MTQVKWLVAFSVAMLVANASTAWGHFPWLVRNADGSVDYFFGEGLNDRTYKLPSSMAAAEIYYLNQQGQPTKLDTQAIEEDVFVGLRSAATVPANSPLYSAATFGIYHGSRLNYYTLHLGGSVTEAAQVSKQLQSKEIADKLGLLAQLTHGDAAMEVQVAYRGQPLADVEVHLYSATGDETGTATTNAQGIASFSNSQLSTGLNGLMFGTTLKEPGKLEDTEYDSVSHYLTATFYNGPSSNSSAESTTVAKPDSKLPALPFEITSFGAVRLDDALYVYGGHTGSAHSYSNESQSNKLLRLRLDGNQTKWEEVSTGPRLQGLGMVAQGDRVILLGGFTALNAEGEEHDLESQSSVHAYDLKSGQWSELPELPEARSSHDAAIIGDTIYVVGGWNMSSGETTWHTIGWKMDLTAAKPEWQAIAKPPFVRRAMATVAHDGKLFVLGGMNEKGGPTKAVAIYDPASDQWSDAPELLGKEGMAGFGAAGWSIDSGLVVTTYEGDIQRWSDHEQQWQSLGKSADARFFHRLLPLDNSRLVSLGGANMEEGKFLNLEIIAP